MDWLVWICAKPFSDYRIYGCPMNMPCLTLIYKGISAELATMIFSHIFAHVRPACIFPLHFPFWNQWKMWKLWNLRLEQAGRNLTSFMCQRKGLHLNGCSFVHCTGSSRHKVRQRRNGTNHVFNRTEKNLSLSTIHMSQFHQLSPLSSARKSQMSNKSFKKKKTIQNLLESTISSLKSLVNDVTFWGLFF